MTLITNNFRLDIKDKSLNIYQYDVALIESDRNVRLIYSFLSNNRGRKPSLSSYYPIQHSTIALATINLSITPLLGKQWEIISYGMIMNHMWGDILIEF